MPCRSMANQQQHRGLFRTKPRKHPAVVSERWRSGVLNNRRWMLEAPVAIIGVQNLGQVFAFVGTFTIFRDQLIALLLCVVQIVNIKRS
jgi:hypothetical protein